MEKTVEDKLAEVADSVLKPGKSNSCPICKHPACEDATQVYFEHNRNCDSVKFYFKNEFNKSFHDDTIKRHFKEHVEPFVKEFSIVKRQKLELLKETLAGEQSGSNRVSMLKEIIWDFATDVYAAKPTNLKSAESKSDHKNMTKQIVDLTKAYRELHQMEMDILGYGKSPEEQRETVRKYLVNYLKQVLDNFEDLPDARDRLQEIIASMTSSPE